MNDLALTIVRRLEQTPSHFSELVDAAPHVAWRDFLHAWGEVRAANVLGRDDDGRYVLTVEGVV